MYTYVFAFYLIKNNQTAIFEDNQAVRWSPLSQEKGDGDMTCGLFMCDVDCDANVERVAQKHSSRKHLQNLEVSTENLSELLEREITPGMSRDDIVKLKQQVWLVFAYAAARSYVFAYVEKGKQSIFCGENVSVMWSCRNDRAGLL